MPTAAVEQLHHVSADNEELSRVVQRLNTMVSSGRVRALPYSLLHSRAAAALSACLLLCILLRHAYCCASCRDVCCRQVLQWLFCQALLGRRPALQAMRTSAWLYVHTGLPHICTSLSIYLSPVCHFCAFPTAWAETRLAFRHWTGASLHSCWSGASRWLSTWATNMLAAPPAASLLLAWAVCRYGHSWPACSEMFLYVALQANCKQL